MRAGETPHTIYPFPRGVKGCSRENGQIDEGVGGTCGWKRSALRGLFGRVYSCLGTKMWRSSETRTLLGLVAWRRIRALKNSGYFTREVS